jgi:hypothetical protein
MRLLRFVKRGALFIAMGAIIFVAGISIYLRIEQYRFRKQAERLLSDVRELELGKATAEQVKVIVSKWGFEQWRGPLNPCTEDNCIYRFRLVPKPAQGHFYGDPFFPGITALPLEWLGLRPSGVQASVQIRGNALKSVLFSVYTAGRGCDGRGRLDCTLMAEAGTNWGSSWSAYDEPDAKLKHSLLHPNYLVGTFSALFNADTGGSPAVVIWAEFSQQAESADISRLMQFDLSCLTRLRSCKQRDLMPTVWARSIEDTHEAPKTLTCTPELAKRVAQLADVIAVVRPKTAALSPPPYNGRPPQLRNLEVVNVIRKLEHLRELALLNVDVDTPEMVKTADTAAPVQASQEYVFLMQERSNPNIGWFALYPCGILTMNEANLVMAREAATNGAD